MFSNKLINEVYDFLLESYSESEANYILTNSLAILGDKKIIVSEELDSFSIKRIEKYKYPERLSSFVKTSAEKSSEWKSLSFAKIACS